MSAFVAVDETEGPVPPERFDDIERMAAFAAAEGVERVAFVGEGVKTIAVEGTADHRDLDVERFEDRASAMGWARGATE